MGSLRRRGGKGINGELTPHRPWDPSQRQTHWLRTIKFKLPNWQREKYLHGLIVAVVLLAAIIGGQMTAGSPNDSQSQATGANYASAQASAKSQLVASDVSATLPTSTNIDSPSQTQATTVAVEEQANSRSNSRSFAGLAFASSDLTEMRQSLEEAAQNLPLPPADILDKLALANRKLEPYTLYTIQRGDTLTSIAAHFGLSMNTLLWNNNELRDDADYLKVGAQITIPASDGIVYTVKLGDTLQGIGAAYGIEPSAIIEFRGNNLSSADDLADGAVLLLPGAKPRAGAPATENTLALASATVEATPSPTAALVSTPSGPVYSGSLSVGDAVQVSSGGCLNARSSPGGDINVCMAEGSVSTIVDGPVYANGFWWWQIKGQGWAVDDYLQAYAGSAPTPAPRSISTGGFIWPTSGSISDGFGVPRGGGTYHNGIDIALPGVHGRAVAASAGGRVVLAQVGYGGGLGNHIIIDHGNGLESVYAHLSSLTVSVGQYVSQGELIGYTGCTGYCLGEHLHYEIRKGGIPVNPLNYLP